MFEIKVYEELLERKIKNSKFKSLPNFLHGKTGYAFHGNIKLFYEVRQAKGNFKGSLLLISRNSESLLFWPEEFIEQLTDAGYEVIRFDHRGLGLSDWMAGWTKKTAFTLEDMARDAMAVVDHLKLKKVHVIGASMGGMIAQRMAIDFPGVVKSLTSIMSSGYFFDPQLVSVSRDIKKKFSKIIFNLTRKPMTLEKRIKLRVTIDHLWQGNGDYILDIDRQISHYQYEFKHKGGINPKVFQYHNKAIKLSGSRLAELEKITTPTLIIHGTKDPLINYEHAKKYAILLRNSKKLFLEGMGHDMPKEYLKPIIRSILLHLITKTNEN